MLKDRRPQCIKRKAGRFGFMWHAGCEVSIFSCVEYTPWEWE